MTTTAKALDIPELFERIILSRPFGDILLAQRACKDWRDKIQASVNIRKALFFEPVSDARVIMGRDEDILVWETADEDNVRALSRPIINPLINKHIKHHRKHSFLAILHEGFINPVNPSGSGKRRSEALRSRHCPEATWRGMILFQPSAEEYDYPCFEPNGNGPAMRHIYGTMDTVQNAMNPTECMR